MKQNKSNKPKGKGKKQKNGRPTKRQRLFAKQMALKNASAFENFTTVVGTNSASRSNLNILTNQSQSSGIPSLFDIDLTQGIPPPNFHPFAGRNHFPPNMMMTNFPHAMQFQFPPPTLVEYPFSVPPPQEHFPNVPVTFYQKEVEATETEIVQPSSSQSAETDISNAIKPGNYTILAFDAFVWTDPQTREQYFLQIGLKRFSEEGFLRWIVPTNFDSLEGCPLKKEGDKWFFCPQKRVEMKNSVDLEKALSDMLKYLKTLKKNQSEGVVLLSYDPEPIICLLNSIVKFDELKLIFIDLVKGLGNLRAYLELGPSENTVGEYTPEAIKSLHSAGLVVLGDVTKESKNDCVSNAMLISAILRRSFGGADPPMNFIRRFFHPPKSILYRKAILNQTLSMSLAKFVPLQKFVEMSLSSYEKHLIPSGVLYKLGTESCKSLSSRLSSGLIRALIASLLEFDYLMEMFLTKGHRGLEQELEQALLPNVVEKNMSNSSKEYQQLSKVVSLVINFFHMHGHKSFSQMLKSKNAAPVKKIVVSPEIIEAFHPLTSEYCKFFSSTGKSAQTLKEDATSFATSLASVGLTLDKMTELWEKEPNFRKNLVGIVYDLMPQSDDPKKLSSFLDIFLSKYVQSERERNCEAVVQEFTYSESKSLMMDALIPKSHISPSAYERFVDDLRSLKPLARLIEEELSPMMKVVVGSSESAKLLTEHFLKMLAYTGNSFSVLLTRYSRGRLSDAVFDCFNLHEDVIPMGLSAIVMTDILERFFDSYQ